MRIRKDNAIESYLSFILQLPKAMSYYLLGELDSKNIFENGLIPSKNYPFGEIIKTPQGESFVKVKDKNLYFSIEDVLIKGE